MYTAVLGLLPLWLAMVGSQGPVVFEDKQPLRPGQSCVETTGRGGPTAGVCRLLRDCPGALEIFKKIGARRPDTCGYQGFNIVVCCPDSLLVPSLPNNGSAVHISRVTSPPVDSSSPPNFPNDGEINASRPVSIVEGTLPPNVSNPLPPEFLCGVRPLWTRASEHRLIYAPDGQSYADGVIVGGFTSDVNGWPWVALLGWRTEEGRMRWRCDGSLINERWIVTAAHCFDRGPPQMIRLGEHDYTNDTDGAPHEDFGIDEVVLYPEYGLSGDYHDLALVRLDRPAPSSKNQITPICLPWGEESRANIVGRSVALTGWGATRHAGELSPVLQEVDLDVFDSSVCDSSYKILPSFSLQFPRGITSDDFICAGHQRGGKDACQGDSGGPIQYRAATTLRNSYVLTGVVSKGYGCGLPDFPGLYTPINVRYLSWIRQVAFQ